MINARRAGSGRIGSNPSAAAEDRVSRVAHSGGVRWLRIPCTDREAAVAEQNLEPTSPMGTYPGLVWSRARKMRENESDSGAGWRGPYDYISPWAARDPGGNDQAPADGPDLPPESGQPDTIAFGKLADEAGGPGQGSYVQRGYGDSWYGGDRDEPGYGSYAGTGGQYGSGSGGYGSDGSYGSEGGYGSGGSGGGYGSGGSYGSEGGYGS